MYTIAGTMLITAKLRDVLKHLNGVKDVTSFKHGKFTLYYNQFLYKPILMIILSSNLIRSF